MCRLWYTVEWTIQCRCCNHFGQCVFLFESDQDQQRKARPNVRLNKNIVTRNETDPAEVEEECLSSTQVQSYCDGKTLLFHFLHLLLSFLPNTRKVNEQSKQTPLRAERSWRWRPVFLLLVLFGFVLSLATRKGEKKRRWKEETNGETNEE
mmetsp:Transcript_24545/g.58245  ORF Transcript_24545/g.58245 Transcript_24545/m.58245 type:complete len:151 (-) Transcript_24545:106-558(-)